MSRCINILTYGGMVFFIIMAAIDVRSENPSSPSLQLLIEKGRQEIIEEAGQCAAVSLTLEECASENGWDLKNG